MALEQKIQQDIMAAMKAHDNVRTNAVRAIKSAILLAKTAEGGKKELEDADIIKLIQKLLKQRKEAAEQYVAAGRQELAHEARAGVLAVAGRQPAELLQSPSSSRRRRSRRGCARSSRRPAPLRPPTWAR